MMIIKPTDLDKFIINQNPDNMRKEEALSGYNTIRLPILESSIKHIETHLNSGVPIMIISADKWGQSAEENNIARRELRADIVFNDLSYIPLSGAWKEKDDDYFTFEHSYMVTGWVRGSNEYIMDFSEFKNLALQWREDYDQTGVIIGSGKNGRYNFDLYEINNNTNRVEVANHFTNVMITTVEDIEKLYKKYLEYKAFKNESVNSGYGYSSLKSTSNKGFNFQNKEESNFYKSHSISEAVVLSTLYVGKKWKSYGYGMYKADDNLFNNGKVNRNHVRMDDVDHV